MVPQTRRVYPVEMKVEVVRRFLAGEAKTSLALEYELSSPQLVSKWAQILREQGLHPNRPGRSQSTGDRALGEVESLRREVGRLRAQNAYLGKLQALVEQQRRSR